MRKDVLAHLKLPVLLSVAMLTAAPSAFAAPKRKAKKTTEAPAAAAAPAPEAPPPEPTVPKRQASNVQCQAPDEVKAETELTIRCSLKNDVRPSSVRLEYRAGSATDYVSVSMDKSPKGWWTANIPASAVRGRSVQYYVEAVGPTGDVLAADGRNDSPNVIYVQNPLPPTPTDTAVVDAAAAPVGPLPYERRRKPGTYWVGAMLGHGVGWHAKQNLEYYDEVPVASNTAGEAGLGHFSPEFGYQMTNELAFSVQTRHQLILRDGTDPGRRGRPATGAHTFMLKGQYDFPGDHYLFYASGMFGVGEGFRLGYGPNADRGVLTNDSLRGGPVVVGPGGGFLYNFKNRLSLVVELNVLFGFTDVAAIADLNAGVQYRL